MVTQPPQPPFDQAATQTCWWHPERQTGLRCTRCDRPACPACLREASVGYQCIDCVQTGQKQQAATHARYRRSGFGQRTVAGAIAQPKAIVTPVLIALNVLVFAFTAIQAGNPLQNQNSATFEWGVLWPYAISFEGEWWRLLASGFLHYGLIHLAMNMFALWVLGRDLEMVLGRLRFVALYVVSLVGGAAAVYAFGEVNAATAGASGAIFGLMGAMAVVVFRLKLNPTSALMIIGLNVVLTISIPGISLLGHLGGLVVGVLVAAALVYAPAKSRTTWQVGTLVFVTAALIGLMVFRDAQLGSQICGVLPTQEFVCADQA